MQYKILITGAAGFIGSTLVKKIIEDYNWEVWALDNNFRYTFELLKEIQSQKLHIVQTDICDVQRIAVLFKNNFDFVIHLAAVPGERLCKIYPEETLMTNIYGTRVLLEEAIKYNLKNFIFASSQVIYGEVKELPIKEDYPPNPYDLYSFSKTADEILLGIYRKKNLPITIFRFSSVYGQGVFTRWDEVMGRFVRLAYEEDYLTLYSPPNLKKAGEQRVDLINVKDITECIIEAIKNTDRVVDKAYNLSYGSSTSILELAELVRDIARRRFNKDLELRTVSTQEEEFSKIEVSDEKIKNELGWKPKITLEEGINELFEKYLWYKKKYGRVKEPALIKTPTRYSS